MIRAKSDVTYETAKAEFTAEQAASLQQFEADWKIYNLLPWQDNRPLCSWNELYGRVGSLNFSQPLYSGDKAPLDIERLLTLADVFKPLPLVRAKSKTYAATYLPALCLPFYGDKRGPYEIEEETQIAPWFIEGGEHQKIELTWFADVPGVGVVEVTIKGLPQGFDFRFTYSQKSYMGGVQKHSPNIVYGEKWRHILNADGEGVADLYRDGYKGHSESDAGRVCLYWVPIHNVIEPTLQDFLRTSV